MKFYLQILKENLIIVKSPNWNVNFNAVKIASKSPEGIVKSPNWNVNVNMQCVYYMPTK